MGERAFLFWPQVGGLAEGPRSDKLRRGLEGGPTGVLGLLFFIRCRHATQRSDSRRPVAWFRHHGVAYLGPPTSPRQAPDGVWHDRDALRRLPLGAVLPSLFDRTGGAGGER